VCVTLRGYIRVRESHAVPARGSPIGTARLVRGAQDGREI
jgi:hypothetical protein